MEKRFPSAYMLLESAVHEEQQIQHQVEEIRQSVKRLLNSTTVGFLYEHSMLVISVFSCFQCIYETYLDRNNPAHRDDVHALEVVETVLSCLYMFDWCLAFFIAESKWRHLFGFFSMVDLLTVIPIWVMVRYDSLIWDDINSFSEAVLYIVFLVNTTRILRALRLRKLLFRVADPVQRFLAEMLLLLIIMILFNAAVMQYLEESTQPYDYHAWLYYIWVTTATVGYGDITPQTLVGRVAAMAMIALAVIIIPKLTSELVDIIKMQSIYARLSYSPKGNQSQHVVICGDIRSLSLKEFFEELFHEDHENIDLNAVILQPDPPSLEMLLLLRDPVLALTVTYVEGSALVDKDLIRAHTNTAVAIFVMANKFSPHADEEDAKTILLQLSIKRFTEASLLRERQLYCLQLIRPENQRLLNASEIDGTNEGVVVVCVNEIKMGVLAKAIMFPGTNTLVMNLISSFADDGDDEDDDNEDEERNKQMSDATANRIRSETSRKGSVFTIVSMGDDEKHHAAKSKRIKEDWLSEYQAGCDWEIYSVSFASIFFGAKFIDLSFLLFQRMGIVLFAIQLRDKKCGVSKVLLNPADYIIPDGTNPDLSVTAFVLAKNQAQSEKLATPSRTEEVFYATALRKQKPPTPNNSISQEISFGSVSSNRTEDVPKEDSQSSNKPKKRQLWKLLKRSHLLAKKIESDSFQEKLQKMEEKHTADSYYVRPHPHDISECFIKTSVIDEVPHVNNHLIIMGKDLSNLYDLIKPLRAKYLGSLKYIVILYPDDIPHAVWKRICYFEALLVVRGSSLEESDIRRAGIFRATQVVVLADSKAHVRAKTFTDNHSLSVESESLVDSDAIFSYQCVKRLNPQTQIVVEIVHHANIAYLENDSSNFRKDQYKFSPQFASGSLFTTSLLDSLICQAFYSPDVIKVVNKLVSGVDQLDRNEMLSRLHGELEANRQNLGGSEQQQKEMEFDDDENAPHKSFLNKMKGSALYLIAIPDLRKKTYGALFKHLARENMIPLGLLRGIYSNIAIGPKSNKMPYVFTNPDRDSEVFICDRVFVLSTVPMQANRLNVKDWIMDIQMHKKLEEQRKKPVEMGGVIGTVASIQKDFEHLEKVQRKMDRRFDLVMEQMGKKFDSVMETLAMQVAERTVAEDKVLAKSNVPPRRMSLMPAQFGMASLQLLQDMFKVIPEGEEDVSTTSDSSDDESESKDKEEEEGTVATSGQRKRVDSVVDSVGDSFPDAGARRRRASSLASIDSEALEANLRPPDDSPAAIGRKSSIKLLSESQPNPYGREDKLDEIEIHETEPETDRSKERTDQGVFQGLQNPDSCDHENVFLRRSSNGSSGGGFNDLDSPALPPIRQKGATVAMTPKSSGKIFPVEVDKPLRRISSSPLTGHDDYPMGEQGVELVASNEEKPNENVSLPSFQTNGDTANSNVCAPSSPPPTRSIAQHAEAAPKPVIAPRSSLPLPAFQIAGPTENNIGVSSMRAATRKRPTSAFARTNQSTFSAADTSFESFFTSDGVLQAPPSWSMDREDK